MRIPSNKPSSLILSQTKCCQKLKIMTRKCLKKVIQKGWCNKPTKLQYQAILIRKISMLSKRYESTEVDRRTWLHVLFGTNWTTNSDTYHFVVIWKKVRISESTGYNQQNHHDLMLPDITSRAKCSELLAFMPIVKGECKRQYSETRYAIQRYKKRETTMHLSDRIWHILLQLITWIMNCLDKNTMAAV